MSSSSSLSAARRRRVGGQQTVQNPPSSVRDVAASRLQNNGQHNIQNNIQERPNMRQNTGAPSMAIPPSAEQLNARQNVNPAQLLMQHDYRLFQIEKMVKTIHENTSKDEDDSNVSKVVDPIVNESVVEAKIDMDEIKGAVSESIYQSDKLQKFIHQEARSCMESSYNFDTFFEGLQKLDQENRLMKDTLLSNQKYINDMNSSLIKLLGEFRELQSVIKDFKAPVLDTIQEVEALIDTSNNSDKISQTEPLGALKNEDSPEEISEEDNSDDNNE